MKKKVLSAVLVLCMLLTVFTSGMTALAEDAFTYGIDVEAQGKVVTVTITMPGEANSVGGNFTFQYNSEKLTFKETVENSSTAVINPHYTENSVRASIASGVFPFTEDTVMWKFTMDYNGGILSSDDFAITAFRIYDENYEIISSNDTVDTDINFSCNHAVTEEKITSEPTHTEDGVQSVMCVVCGEILSTESIPAVGHSFGEWVETKPATCTKSGEETRTCTCGATETRDIAPTGHTYGKWVETTAPTCTKPGEETRTCSVCGNEEKREISATGHAPSEEWEQTIDPTCTEPGEEVNKCKVCGGVLDTRTVPATGHTPGEWTVVTEPTCTENGEKEAYCEVCGEKFREAIPATGHTPSEEWEQTIAPTCTEPGEEVNKCEVCGEVLDTRTVPATGHTPGEWNVVTEPTCTDDGEKEAYCEVCGERFTEVISATGHTAGEWEIITPATCTTNGERKTTCEVCGAEYTDTIPATGHQYGEWTVIKEATETEAGLKERVCEVCGEKDSEVIPVLATEMPSSNTNAAESDNDTENVTVNRDTSSKSPDTGLDTSFVIIAFIGVAVTIVATLSFIRRKRSLNK